MQALIKSRREELSVDKNQEDQERKDLFRVMLRASEGEGQLRMTDDELVSSTLLRRHPSSFKPDQ
jgi:cytochrome P450